MWHELFSDLVHLDVAMWMPTPARPMYTFATAGMSDLRMSVPDGARESGSTDRAELVVCLPSGWPVPYPPAPWDTNAYFPIRWLKTLARLPHEHRTWLGYGHSVPNEDPPAPLSMDTFLCGWLLLPPTTLPGSFQTLALPDNERLDLFGIVAVHRDELDQKLNHGVETLLEGFSCRGVNEFLDLRRGSVVTP